MTAVGFSRTGRGEPLVLLHGLGSARGAWDPVVPALTEHFDVIALDLPGFGTSAPLPPGVEPSPAELAIAVAGLLDALRVDRPHLVGHSLGGWVAIELAKTRPVRTVTLVSPAGLWRRGTPLYSRLTLRLAHWLSRRGGRALSRMVATRPGRILMFGQMSAHPARATTAQARSALRAMAACPGFDATLRATTDRRLQDAQGITAPLTVVFGSHDRVLLRRQSRVLAELPVGTRADTLPDCGHVPMGDDPAGVVALILASTLVRQLPEKLQQPGGEPP